MSDATARVAHPGWRQADEPAPEAEAVGAAA